MDYEALGKRIFDVCYLTGQFKLRSGKISNEYFDKYQFESDPEILNLIAESMVQLLPQEYDILAGLETGGIPIATAMALKVKKPVVFVRKKAKEYGTSKLAEGVDIKGKKIVIIEDVVTSGGQIIESIKQLYQLGAIVSKAICVIDREEGGKENLQKIGISFASLYTTKLLKEIARSTKV
ncbi:MAG: orotate phosphoribosyltransferase [Candidatus Kapaibacteriales bacterium]